MELKRNSCKFVSCALMWNLVTTGMHVHLLSDHMQLLKVFLGFEFFFSLVFFESIFIPHTSQTVCIAGFFFITGYLNLPNPVFWADRAAGQSVSSS